MQLNKSKWLAYTVIIGLIPILSRLFLWMISNNENFQCFSATDFVAFGLMLHIANINELEHQPTHDQSWKTIQNGVSILFIAVYTMLYGATLWGETYPGSIKVDVVLLVAIILSLTSFLLSISIFHRLYNTPNSGPP